MCGGCFPASAGALTPEEVEKVMSILEDPASFNIPLWFLNRQKDWVSGKNFQNYGAQVAISLRDDLERLKKIRCVGVCLPRRPGLRLRHAVDCPGRWTCWGVPLAGLSRHPLTAALFLRRR